MRQSLRLLAQVKPGRFLEANAPTGLTGLTTHPTPRPSLILIYKQTLDRLKQLPESSVYRQSCEALTRYRLKIIEDTKPAGYAEWRTRAEKKMAEHPELFENARQPDGSIALEYFSQEGSEVWDGAKKDPQTEGSNTKEQAMAKGQRAADEVKEREAPGAEDILKISDLELEPPLDSDQINAVEEKIGAGLLEEVISVAEGELELVQTLAEAQVWQPLEEKAPAGQWLYFERDPAGV